MILGLGVDIVPIRRMENELEDIASGFFTGAFTPAEIQYCETAVSQKPAQHFAARYAVKEAFFKALGLVMARHGRTERVSTTSFINVEVIVNPGGFPTITLHNRTQKIAQEVGVKSIWTSLTHDDTSAIAVVVLEG